MDGGLKLGAAPVDSSKVCRVIISDNQGDQTVGIARHIIGFRVNHIITGIQHLDGHRDCLVGHQAVVGVTHHSLITDNIAALRHHGQRHHHHCDKQ